MCTTYSATVSQMHNRAAAAPSDLQEAGRLYRENCARADGRESLSPDNHTEGGRCHPSDQSAQADLGVADGARAESDLLSIHDTGSVCCMLSEARVRAARGLSVDTVPAEAADD